MTWTEFVDLAKKAPELFELRGYYCDLLAIGEVCFSYFDVLRPETAAKIQNNVLVGLERFDENGPYTFHVEIHISGGVSYQITVIGPDADGFQSDYQKTLLEAYIRVREAFVNG